MKVAQFSLPLSAILAIGVSQSVLAGPQSLLDPYYNVKAPTKKATAGKKPAAARPVAPTSVMIGGPDLPPLKKDKDKKGKPLASEPERAPAAASAPVSSSGVEGEGFIAGTRQIFKGFATAAKGAVVTPSRAIGSGVGKVADSTKVVGGKMVDSTKAVGGKVADGTKSSGGFFVNGMKSIGGGFKAAGEKMAVVPKKMGEGLMAAGGKVKDGTVAAGHAVAAAPGAIGNGAKAVGGKVADTTGAATEKAKDGGTSLGGKMIAMPKAMGKGMVGAAAKTGEVTKKVATAPIGFFGKLNPFHKKDAPAVQTAGAPKAGTPAAH